MNRNAVIGLVMIVAGIVVMALALTENEEPAYEPDAPWRSDWVSAGELDTSPPAGYCRAGEETGALKVQIHAIVAGRPLLMDGAIGDPFVPCTDSALAAGSRADLQPRRFGFYAIKARNSDAPPATSRGKPVSTLSDYIAVIGRLYGPEKDLPERIEKGARDAPMLGAVNIGLIGSAPYTLFFGSLNDGSPEQPGTVMAEIFGASRYGDSILSIMLVAPYEGPGTFDALLDAAKDAMARTEAASRE